MIGLVGACSTGIGLAGPLIAACLRWMFGFDDTRASQVINVCSRYFFNKIREICSESPGNSEIRSL